MCYTHLLPFSLQSRQLIMHLGTYAPSITCVRSLPAILSMATYRLSQVASVRFLLHAIEMTLTFNFLLIALIVCTHSTAVRKTG